MKKLVDSDFDDALEVGFDPTFITGFLALISGVVPFFLFGSVKDTLSLLLILLSGNFVLGLVLGVVATRLKGESSLDTAARLAGAFGLALQMLGGAYLFLLWLPVLWHLMGGRGITPFM